MRVESSWEAKLISKTAVFRLMNEPTSPDDRRGNS